MKKLYSEIGGAFDWCDIPCSCGGNAFFIYERDSDKIDAKEDSVNVPFVCRECKKQYEATVKEVK